MTIPKLALHGLDTVQHGRRVAESINDIVDFKNDDWRRTTKIERVLGVTPLAPSYPPGDVRRYGAVGDGVHDDAPAIQTAWDVVKESGGRVVFPMAVYRCDSLLDFRRDVVASQRQFHYEIDGQCSVLDFSNISSDSGNLIHFGATAQANTNECGRYVVRNLTVIGKDSAAITASNARATTQVGMAFSYVVGALVLENLHSQYCFKGYEFNFCFPISARAVISQNCCIGAHVGSDNTTGVWRNCGFRNGRFGLLIQPHTDSTAVSGQTFIGVNLEGNYVGCVMDPLDGGGTGIRLISFDDPYVEAVDYSAFRIGRALVQGDANDPGDNRERDIAFLRWEGGTWDQGVSDWGSSGHDAILGPSSPAVSKPYSIQLIGVPIPDAGFALSQCRDVTFLKAKGQHVGSSDLNFHAPGGYYFCRFDGTGSTGLKTLRVAKNITQVEKIATGEWEVTFERPYASGDAYVVTANAHGGGQRYVEALSTSAGTCTLRCYDDTGALADPASDISVATFGAE